MRVSRSLFLFGALLFCGVLHSNVNVNNGNFHVAFLDLQVRNGGLGIEIIRTYNSRSNFIRGLFGVGWSSELDTYLRTENEKTITYYHGGGGNVLRFVRAPKSDLYENKRFGYQKLKQLKNGFILETSSSRRYRFNQNGQLTKIEDSNKNFIELERREGLLVRLRDNFNNQVNVKTEKHGAYPRVVLLSRGGEKARYRYNKLGNLIKAKGADAIPFEYDYDRKHNMTAIKYADGSSKKLKYNSLKDWVTEQEEVDGYITQYFYFSDKLDPENKFGTTVSRFLKGNEQKKEIARFWYEFRKRKDGSKYNQRSLNMLGDQITETIYSECCGTPLTISKWRVKEVKNYRENSYDWVLAKGEKKVTKFEYFADGLLKRKIFPTGRSLRLSYHPKTKRIASMIRGRKKIEYHYDKQENLAWAVDHELRKRLDLSYDLNGRITILKEKDVKSSKDLRTVYFNYDQGGRPNIIKEKLPQGDEGSIQISYGKQGEVLSVLNGQGRRLASGSDGDRASRIYDTFQYLLDIVEPSGLNLEAGGG